MARTYIPGLRLVNADWDRYTKRWSTKLQLSMTPESYAKLLLAISAVDALIVELGPATFEDESSP